MCREFPCKSGVYLTVDYTLVVPFLLGKYTYIIYAVYVLFLLTKTWSPFGDMYILKQTKRRAKYMRHRLQRKVFDGGGNRSSSPQNPRTSSTFTHSYNGKNPHLTKSNNKLHSKSTYFCRWGSRLSSKLNYVVPSVCALALLIGGIIAINPTSSMHKAKALDISKVTNQKSNDAKLSISIDGDPNEVVTAQPGVVAYRSNNINITAQNYNSYAVILSAMRGYGSELRGKKNAFATVSGVGNNVAPADFTNNSWGYAVTQNTAMTDAELANLTYNTVPAYENDAYVANSTGIPSGTTVNDNYKLVFAAKFGNDMPSDNYQGQLMLSVIGSPDQLVFSGIQYMQDMTSTICKNETNIGVSRQLIDNRDNKYYWVSKLADGNCWMTQNLDLDLDKSQPLTVDNTDITENWTPTNSTMVGDLKTSDNDSTNVWSNKNDVIQSWDPGNYYYTFNQADPVSGWTNCARQVASNLSNCPNIGSWTTTISATSGGEHYHVGNYYSWNTATADTGKSITSSAEATSSICPRNWKLPSNIYANGSFGALLTAYSIRNTSSNNNAGSDALRKTPLYFIPSGNITSAGISSTGYHGEYWTSSARTSKDAYFLQFDAAGITASHMIGNNDVRSWGMSVRCVAK